MVFALDLSNNVTKRLQCIFVIFAFKHILPASVALLDVSLTGDQEIAGSIPVRSATFFLGDLIM